MYVPIYIYCGFVALFNGISAFMGYLMSKKNSSDII